MPSPSDRPRHPSPGMRAQRRPLAGHAGATAHRTLFLSDIHLGSRHCHASELASFLKSTSCERLYLVGDVVDLWYLAHRRATWGHAQNRVVEALHTQRRTGAAIVYVPGNHDRPIRRF